MRRKRSQRRCTRCSSVSWATRVRRPVSTKRCSISSGPLRSDQSEFLSINGSTRRRSVSDQSTTECIHSVRAGLRIAADPSTESNSTETETVARMRHRCATTGCVALHDDERPSLKFRFFERTATYLVAVARDVLRRHHARDGPVIRVWIKVLLR